MRILTYTTLYPNREQPRHGIFIRTRLARLRANHPVESTVIAPVPWFPSDNPRFGRYAVYAGVPVREPEGDVDVRHPRYPVLPGLSWQVAPIALYLATRGLAARLHAERRFDLIDAHYFFPDGVAAVLLGRHLGIPVVITARGSDITVLPGYRLPRRLIDWAGRNAAAMVTVCRALRDELVRLGQDATRITVLRNGVDLEFFVEVDRNTVRKRYGITESKILLSVGNLVELKGNHLTLEALAQLPDTALVVVGDGPERARLDAIVRGLALGDRVHFAGTVPQAELRDYYSAADAIVLASRSEGWANVLLEAMACGCPAVASNVWGTPEVVGAPAAGRLMAERTPEAIAAAVRDLFADYPGRPATRAYAEGFDWNATSRGQYELFRSLLGETVSG